MITVAVKIIVSEVKRIIRPRLERLVSDATSERGTLVNTRERTLIEIPGKRLSPHSLPEKGSLACLGSDVAVNYQTQNLLEVCKSLGRGVYRVSY